jgi:peptidoglycan/LPS O-acetylase OafA/YrhL
VHNKPASSITEELRLLELDGLRGLAVFLVLLWHFIGAMVDTELGWWAKASYRTFIFGRTGVDLFFVLSGFLITRVVLTRTLSGTRFLKVFYLKRALRILPPYLLLVAIFWAVVSLGVNNAVFNSDTPLWRHLSFTQNFWMSEKGTWGPSGISVSWSLAIEEHYYLFFPLLALIVPRKALPGLLGLTILSSIFCRAAMHYFYPGNAYLGYVMTFSRLDGLAAGGLLAFAITTPTLRSWLENNTKELKKLLWFLIAIVPLFCISIAGRLTATMFYWGHTYLTLLYVTVLALVILNIGADCNRWLRSEALRSLGKISYSVYLFHPLFIASFFLIANRPERISTWTDAGLAFAALVFTIIISRTMYRYYERPILEYGKQKKY